MFWFKTYKIFITFAITWKGIRNFVIGSKKMSSLVPSIVWLIGHFLNGLISISILNFSRKFFTYMQSWVSIGLCLRPVGVIGSSSWLSLLFGKKNQTFPQWIQYYDERECRHWSNPFLLLISWLNHFIFFPWILHPHIHLSKYHFPSFIQF